MEQSPAVLTACVTSTTAGTGATAASAVEKAGTSTAPRAGGGGEDDLCMTNPRPTSHPQTTKAGGTHAEDDAHWCLYVGTPWEEEVVADHCDVDQFKEASCTIGRVLSVRVLASVLEILALSHDILQGLISGFACCWHSLASPLGWHKQRRRQKCLLAPTSVAAWFRPLVMGLGDVWCKTHYHIEVRKHTDYRCSTSPGGIRVVDLYFPKGDMTTKMIE
jgi:hypothetical protein